MNGLFEKSKRAAMKRIYKFINLYFFRDSSLSCESEDMTKNASL